MRFACILGLLLATLPGSVGQPTAGPPPPDEGERVDPRLPPPLRFMARRLLDGFGSDEAWAEQQGYMVSALEQVFAQNGWTSEPDQFSLDVLREVSAVPPWQVARRLDVLTARFSDRYSLDEDQTRRLRTLVDEQVNEFFERYAPQFMPEMMEALQTRIAGEPFTAEQVARWAQKTKLFARDARQRFDRRVAEFAEVLTLPQRDLLAVDLEALNQRANRMDELGETWARGEWNPADWGLVHDPIQQGERHPPRTPGQPEAADQPDGGGVAVPAPAPGAAGPATPPPAGAAHRASSRPAEAHGADDPWVQYVRDFVRRFRLDEAQERRAWIIAESACQRRDVEQKRFETARAELVRAPAADEAARGALAKLAREHQEKSTLLFESLQRRLDRLPTRAQRRDAAPATSAPAPAAPVPTQLGGP